MKGKTYIFPDKQSQNNKEVDNILRQLNLADEELILTQRELFKRKADFADFSYSISHTLRKNIANIKGLLNLINEIEIV